MSSWEDEPRRDEVRAELPDVPKHGRKKKTRKWCKGKVGVEHRPEIVIDERTAQWRSNFGNRPPCYRPDWLVRGGRLGRRPLSWSWLCSHIKRCTVCGKIIEPSLGTECPDYTPNVTVFKDEELLKLRRATKK